MKQFKRLLAIALAVALLAGFLAVPTTAAPKSDAAFGGDTSPVVLIHGNTQSDVFLYEADNKTKILDEDDNPIKNWMPKVDITALILGIIGPLLLSVLFQRDMGLTKAAKSALGGVFTLLRMDDKGFPAENMRVEKYVDAQGRPVSLAECPEEMRDTANRRLRINERDQRLGDEKVYYFAYDSFGNNAYNTRELAEYIKAVSKKHGGSKVSVVAISLGGTLLVSLLEDYYKQVVPLLRNVVFVVSAIDGTSLVGDLYTRQLSVDNKNLYRDMIPALLEFFPDMMPPWVGYLLNMAIRIFPKRVVQGLLDAVVDVFVGEYLYRNTTLWTLVPDSYYELARDMWLQGDENAAVRAQTDHYNQAQKNSRANILKMRGDGVRVYAICNYDVPLVAIASSYTKTNADSVIHLDSASLGATSGFVNTPLPADYKPVNPRCADHNHMSPDGIVDASTGALPEQTWYYRGGVHDRSSDNDLVMRLIIRLGTSSKYETVHSMPEWPQFNHARESRWMRNDLLPQAEAVDPAALREKDAKELAGAIAEARVVLAKTIGVPGEFEAAQDRLYAILAKIGLRDPVRRDWAGMVLSPVLSFVNDALYRVAGPRGFFDPFWARWR